MASRPTSKRGLRVIGLCSLVPAALLLGGQARTQQPGTKSPERQICRVETPTGSRFTTRICRTQAEWDRRSDLAQKEALDQQLSGTAAFGKAPTPR